MGVDLSDAALAALAKFMGPEFGAWGLKAGLTGTFRASFAAYPACGQPMQVPLL